jgi:DNA-binding MarR family transcriptional regulator
LRLLRCSARIEKTLQSRLKQEFGTSLSCFDALAQLDRFPAGLSMTDLSLHLMVSNGATTGLVSKLILEGLVQRAIDPADQRTTIVRLTAKGRQNFKTMAVRHEEWVISILGELSSVAQVELLRNLGKLKTLLKSHEFDV